VPEEHWGFPSWINQTRAAEVRKEMEEADIIYGGSASYRFMCRYNSGFFFRHPLSLQYQYYWRVEPGVAFPCTLNFDPFQRMVQYKKRYAFVITLEEVEETVPTLWAATKTFEMSYPKGRGHLDYYDNGGVYSGCHYWSNFEIADMTFFRSEEYLAYFEHLDRIGGFFCALLTRLHDVIFENCDCSQAGGHLSRGWGIHSCCHYWSNFEIADSKYAWCASGLSFAQRRTMRTSSTSTALGSPSGRPSRDCIS
jgi:hypothetical protein